MLVNHIMPLVSRGLIRQGMRQCLLSPSHGVRCLADEAAPMPSISENEIEETISPQQSDDSVLSRRDYRFIFPEFLPDPNPEWRNSLAEKLARRDMLNRRENVEIPEFYVGSYVAVSVSDKSSPHPNKVSRFVGICIDRGGTGLRAWFIVRNVIDGQGVEFMYQMYNPSLLKIEVLKLEKSIDEELYYLRDAPQQYSTVPFDMEPQILPEGSSVPINDNIIKLNARPWTLHWDRYADILYKGYTIENPYPTPGKVRRIMRWMAEGCKGHELQTWKYDMMRDYRNTIPTEQQDQIWEEVGQTLETRDTQMRRVAAKRAFVRPTKKM